jgi:hypothetical protein
MFLHTVKETITTAKTQLAEKLSVNYLFSKGLICRIYKERRPGTSGAHL